MSFYNFSEPVEILGWQFSQVTSYPVQSFSGAAESNFKSMPWMDRQTHTHSINIINNIILSELPIWSDSKCSYNDNIYFLIYLLNKFTTG